MGNENPIDGIVTQSRGSKAAADRFTAIDQQADRSKSVEVSRMITVGRGSAVANAKTSQGERLSVRGHASQIQEPSGLWQCNPLLAGSRNSSVQRKNLIAD